MKIAFLRPNIGGQRRSNDAIELIKKNSGSHFDPECVEAVLKDWHEVLYIKAKYKDEEEG